MKNIRQWTRALIIMVVKSNYIQFFIYYTNYFISWRIHTFNRRWNFSQSTNQSIFFGRIKKMSSSTSIRKKRGNVWLSTVKCETGHLSDAKLISMANCVCLWRMYPVTWISQMTRRSFAKYFYVIFFQFWVVYTWLPLSNSKEGRKARTGFFD